MKRLIGVVILSLTLILSACGSSETTGASKSIAAADVVQVLKDAGLEAENTRAMTKDDYGAAPMTAKEGLRFYIPSLGDDKGGRILIFKNQKDLEATKTYYDEMGKASAMFFSWTAAHGDVLIQINGDLQEGDYNKYKAAIETIE